MKKILPIILLFITNSVLSQTVSMRVIETSYSSTDPDGAGPATGSVTLQFELQTSSGTILGDGMGLSFVYQSSMLMATPTNTTTAEGPVASSTGWSQNVDNRPGTDVSVTYGGKTFDKRMIIAFAQGSGLDNASFTSAWTPVAQVTYWTLGSTAPEGGYVTPESGSILPQNTLSSDGGLTSYDFLSPNLNSPIAVGSGALPVLFTKFDASCGANGTVVSWSTGSESNSSYFELQRSTNGNVWSPVASLKASGNSAGHTYQQRDLSSGNAFYRIREVDADGKSIYTSIIKTNCQLKGINLIIYPVPARDLLNVVIQSDRNLKTNLLIVDGNGKIVRQMQVSVVTGSNSYQLNLQGLASGEYIIRSNGPDAELNKVFNIIR